MKCHCKRIQMANSLFVNQNTFVHLATVENTLIQFNNYIWIQFLKKCRKINVIRLLQFQWSWSLIGYSNETLFTSSNVFVCFEVLPGNDWYYFCFRGDCNGIVNQMWHSRVMWNADHNMFRLKNGDHCLSPLNALRTLTNQ